MAQRSVPTMQIDRSRDLFAAGAEAAGEVALEGRAERFGVITDRDHLEAIAGRDQHRFPKPHRRDPIELGGEARLDPREMLAPGGWAGAMADADDE